MKCFFGFGQVGLAVLIGKMLGLIKCIFLSKAKNFAARGISLQQSKKKFCSLQKNILNVNHPIFRILKRFPAMWIKPFFY